MTKKYDISPGLENYFCGSGASLREPLVEAMKASNLPEGVKLLLRGEAKDAIPPFVVIVQSGYLHREKLDAFKRGAIKALFLSPDVERLKNDLTLRTRK